MQLLYGPNTNESNNACYRSKEFDRRYEKSRRLADGPERDRLYHEMTRRMEVDTVWLLADSRIRNALQQPQVVGFTKHPVLHAEWLYLDLAPRSGTEALLAYVVRRLCSSCRRCSAWCCLVFFLSTLSAAIRPTCWRERSPTRRRSRTSAAARRGPALCGPAVDLHQADRERRFWRELVDQRAGSEIFATRLGPSLTVLRAAARDQHAARDGGGDAGRLPARLAHRRAIMIGCTVGQSISILVYILVFQYVLAYSSAGSRCRAGASASPRTCCATACSRSSSASRFRLPRTTPLSQLLPRRDQSGLRAYGARQGLSEAPRDVGARSPQRGDPDLHQ